MSETAGDIVNDALIELTVQANEQRTPAVELNAGIRYLNRMMQAWDASGIKLGYTRVDSPNDVLTVPAGAIEGIIFNLALRLANGYDVPVSPTLFESANQSLRTIRIIGIKTGKAAFPSTLPVGSGNESEGGAFGSEQFYPDCCEDVNPCGLNGAKGDSNV